MTAKKAKRKANKGSFKKGFDPRRHALTREERRRGFASLVRAARGSARSKQARRAAYVLDLIASGFPRPVQGAGNWALTDDCSF